MDSLRNGPQQLAVMVKNSDAVAEANGTSLKAVREHLPYWITKASLSGEFNDLYSYAVLRGNDQEKGSSFSQMTLLQLGGFWVVYAGLTGLLLAARVVLWLESGYYTLWYGTLAEYFEERMELEIASRTEVFGALTEAQVSNIAKDLPAIITAEFEQSIGMRKRLFRPTRNTLRIRALLCSSNETKETKADLKSWDSGYRKLKLAGQISCLPVGVSMNSLGIMEETVALTKLATVLTKTLVLAAKPRTLKASMVAEAAKIKGAEQTRSLQHAVTTRFIRTSKKHHNPINPLDPTTALAKHASIGWRVGEAVVVGGGCGILRQGSANTVLRKGTLRALDADTATVVVSFSEGEEERVPYSRVLLAHPKIASKKSHHLKRMMSRPSVYPDIGA
jgi:hypothetical protein